MPYDVLPRSGPSLPGYLLYPVGLLSALIILFVMVRSRERAAAFVIGATWLRYIMQAFHTFTYRPIAAGISGVAIASMGTFLIGLLVINWRHLALRFLLPFYGLIALTIVSALANDGLTPDLMNVLVKHGYLLVMILSVFGAMTRARSGDFMASMLWTFLPVFVLQVLSIVFDIGKATETDVTAVSYIGGYYHEAAFSVILATCLTVACFTSKLNRLAQIAIIVVCVVGVVLANYRTTLVAIAPLLLMFFAFSSLRRFPLRDRPFVVSALIVLVAIALGGASLLFADRFQDVAVATSGDVDFFKRPEYYTVEESRLISGRPRIWSGYIFAWLDADLEEHVIGFGPESWNDDFIIYAHNTLVNYLYEYGLVGVVVILWVWFSMLAAALRVRHPHAGVLVGAHLSFLVLNMSTMPMWMIEGNILYGIICGYTLYLLSLQSRTPQQA
ncbi:MAG: O-antigen ligase family protein [Caulobacteraceae bacterium]